MEEEINFSSITRKYRKEQNLSQEKFGVAVSEKVPQWSLSSQAISLWEQGKTEASLEDLFWVFLLCSDWRMQWAIDCIIAMMPDVFARDENGALTVLSAQ